MRRVLFTVLSLAICSCVVGTDEEEVDDAGETTGTAPTALTLPLTSVADATVRSGSYANQNFGKKASLVADLDDGQRAYLRFDVPDHAYSSAKLRLYVTEGSKNAADVFVVSNTTWSESTITWNTRPTVDGPLLGSFTATTAGAWVEVDVTQAVHGGQPLSLALVPRSNDSAGFGSRERSTGKPELVLTQDDTTTTPPPDTEPEPEPTPTDPPVAAPATTCPTSGYTRLVSVSTTTQLVDALKNAQPGDQIRLAAGTYSSTSSMSLSRSGTASSRITLCGMPGVWPVVHANFKLSGAFITIAGLVFEGPNNSQNNVYMASPHDILFTHNEVRHSDWHAGIAVEGSYNVTISYNFIHDNGFTSIDHGIYYRHQATTPTTRNVIANNVIANNAGRGVSMHDNEGLIINYTTVVNNTISWCANTGILLSLNGGTANTIVNNVVANNSRGEHHRQIRYVSGTGNTIANNIAWSSISGDSGMEAMPDNTVTGNVVQDPKFVDANDDFHLQATSPAIGLALAGYVTTDFDGNARDGDPDSGAYEY
jgi:hypothetical protein